MLCVTHALDDHLCYSYFQVTSSETTPLLPGDTGPPVPSAPHQGAWESLLSSRMSQQGPNGTSWKVLGPGEGLSAAPTLKTEAWGRTLARKQVAFGPH